VVLQKLQAIPPVHDSAVLHGLHGTSTVSGLATRQILRDVRVLSYGSMITATDVTRARVLFLALCSRSTFPENPDGALLRSLDVNPRFFPSSHIDRMTGRPVCPVDFVSWCTAYFKSRAKPPTPSTDKSTGFLFDI
jgi:hypothetical protein